MKSGTGNGYGRCMKHGKGFRYRKGENKWNLFKCAKEDNETFIDTEQSKQFKNKVAQIEKIRRFHY